MACWPPASIPARRGSPGRSDARARQRLTGGETVRRGTCTLPLAGRRLRGGARSPARPGGVRSRRPRPRQPDALPCVPRRRARARRVERRAARGARARAGATWRTWGCGRSCSWRSATGIPASGCRSGSRLARKGGRTRAASWPRSSRATATAVRAGRVTRQGCCRRLSPGLEGLETIAGVSVRSRRCSRSSAGASSGFEAACGNCRAMLDGRGAFERGSPTLEDYPIVLRGSKGEVTDREPAALYARACRQGWPAACASLR